MAQVTGAPTSGDDALAAYLKKLEGRIARLEQEQARGITYRDGTRIRVNIGLQTNGTYGIRIWDAAGTLQYTQTW